MNLQPTLFDSERRTMRDALELTRQSLLAYGENYDHWAIAFSGGKDSTATVTVICHLLETGAVPRPKSLAVLYADTRMELPPLHFAAMGTMERLRERGFATRVVLPLMDKRFFVFMYDYAKCDAPPGSRSVSYRVRCPYGFIGDRLWVRETWGLTDIPGGPVVAHRATDKRVMKWRPSIFMPRWASRLTLELVMVRLERLQDISVAGIAAEGVHKTEDGYWLGPDGYPYGHAHQAFQALWDSINAARGLGWDANPWVWVLRFKKVEQVEGLPA